MRLNPLFLMVLLTLTGGVGGASSEEILRRELDLGSGGEWIGNAVCYGPHRDGQQPGGGEPSRAELLEDLRLMSPHWSLLRIYGSSGFAQTLLDLIREEGLPMRVMLGVWLNPESESEQAGEVAAAIRLANEYAGIVLAVSVGNESQVHWSPHRVEVERLLAAVRRVRAGVRVPVTAADDYNFWNKPESAVVAAEIDFLTLHAHPMWNGIQREQALAWLDGTVIAVAARHPGLPVVVGETGWASAVHDEGEQARLILGNAGEVEQQLYYDQVRAWARASSRPVFFFEAFDENWKGGPHPMEVEKHWGLFRADRSGKAAMRD